MSSRSAGWRVSRGGRVGATLLAVIVLLCAVGPSLLPGDPLAIGDVVGARLLPPLARDAAGALHPLGTDAFGRDLLARMLLAGRVSLAVGVLGSLLAAALGAAAGAWSGWRRGAVDRTLMALTDALLSVPRLVLLLVCSALWRPGIGTVVAVLALTGWMGVARLVRAEVLGVRERAWVDAAWALGASPGRVLRRHVLPSALGPAVVAATLGVGNAILLESGLSFLGLGIQPPRPSWGNMIAGGRELVVSAPWVAVAPGVALVVTVWACTLLGDGAREPAAGPGG